MPRGESQLKRAISRKMLLLLVVGDILGAGIYALVGEVGGRVGGGIWAAFLLALTLALFTAFGYAELVTKYPRAAGAALYVNKEWRNPSSRSWLRSRSWHRGSRRPPPWPAPSEATICRRSSTHPPVLVAVGFLAVVAVVNFIGISESVKLNVVLTAIELTGLLLVVGAGLAAIIDGASGVDPGRVLEFKEGESTALAVIAGAGLAFYALIGFEDSMNMAEEVRDPQRAYPRALFGGLAIAGGVYMVVTLVTSAVVPTERLAASDGPLLEVVSVGPWQMSPKLFSAIALFALANGALITMIMTSRGVVTACGLAQGIDLPASVLPFILRNVTLAGIDSVNAPQPVRIEAWTRLATDLDLNKLALATHVVGLADVPDVVARMTDGGVRGRTVVDLNA